MLNSTGYYKHILKCSEQMEDGRMILFDPDSGKTHVLNATAVKFIAYVQIQNLKGLPFLY